MLNIELNGCSSQVTGLIYFFLFFGPQEKVRNSQKQEIFCTILPIESSQCQSTIPIQPQRDLSKQPQKLNCFQCSCHITSKPEVIQLKVICVRRNDFTSTPQLFLIISLISACACTNAPVLYAIKVAVCICSLCE